MMQALYAARAAESEGHRTLLLVGVALAKRYSFSSK